MAMVEEKTREHSGGVHLALRFVVVLWWFFFSRPAWPGKKSHGRRGKVNWLGDDGASLVLTMPLEIGGVGDGLWGREGWEGGTLAFLGQESGIIHYCVYWIWPRLGFCKKRCVCGVQSLSPPEIPPKNAPLTPASSSPLAKVIHQVSPAQPSKFQVRTAQTLPDGRQPSLCPPPIDC